MNDNETDSIDTDPVYAAIAAKLAPGGRLLRHRALTGGVSANIEALQIERTDGSRLDCVVRSPRTNEWKPREHDFVSAEYRLLEVLAAHDLAVPRVLLLDASLEILPAPCYVMELITGTTEVAAHQVDAAMEQMAAFLARLHGLDPVIAAPAGLPEREDPIAGLLQFVPDTAANAALRAAAASWRLSPFRPALLHGDFWPGNLLWHEGRLAAVLDWEDAALGSALADLATARCELMVGFGAAAMERFTAEYLRRTGLDLTDLPLWEIYAGAAALATMADWGLPEAEEAQRRTMTTRFVARAERELLRPRRRL